MLRHEIFERPHRSETFRFAFVYKNLPRMFLRVRTQNRHCAVLGTVITDIELPLAVPLSQNRVNLFANEPLAVICR